MELRPPVSQALTGLIRRASCAFVVPSTPLASALCPCITPVLELLLIIQSQQALAPFVQQEARVSHVACGHFATVPRLLQATRMRSLNYPSSPLQAAPGREHKRTQARGGPWRP